MKTTSQSNIKSKVEKEFQEDFLNRISDYDILDIETAVKAYNALKVEFVEFVNLCNEAKSIKEEIQNGTNDVNLLKNFVIRMPNNSIGYLNHIIKETFVLDDIMVGLIVYASKMYASDISEYCREKQ